MRWVRFGCSVGGGVGGLRVEDCVCRLYVGCMKGEPDPDHTDPDLALYKPVYEPAV